MYVHIFCIASVYLVCLHACYISIFFFNLHVLLFLLLVNLYESEGGKTNVIGSTDKDQKKGYVLVNYYRLIRCDLTW